MSKEALERITAKYGTSGMLIVFADHRTCARLSESVYREIRKVQPHNVVMAGYELGCTNGDVFYTDGIPVSFSAQEYDAVREEFPQLGTRKGAVTAAYVCNDAVYKMYLGSTKTNVMNKIVNFHADSLYRDKPMSQASIIAALVLLMSLVAFGIWLTFSLLSDFDIFVKFRILMLLLGGVIVIILLIDRFIIQGTFRAGYPDLDLAMVLSFIPGLGLLYLKKLRGLIPLLLVIFNAYLLYLLFGSGTFEFPISSFGLLFAFFFVPAFSFIGILYMSCMETQYFCSMIGGNEWGSIMSRTVESHEKYAMAVLYIILIVLALIFVRDYYLYSSMMLILFTVYPAYEWYSRKHR